MRKWKWKRRMALSTADRTKRHPSFEWVLERQFGMHVSWSHLTEMTLVRRSKSNEWQKPQTRPCSQLEFLSKSTMKSHLVVIVIVLIWIIIANLCSDFLIHFLISFHVRIATQCSPILIYRHVIVVWIHHHRRIGHPVIGMSTWAQEPEIAPIRVWVRRAEHLCRPAAVFVLLMEMSMVWGKLKIYMDFLLCVAAGSATACSVRSPALRTAIVLMHIFSADASRHLKRKRYVERTTWL